MAGIERAVARALGKLGGARAKFNGLEGVFAHLVEEHRQLATLLARAEISFDPEKRAELWAMIRPDLVVHERAEAQVVYGEIRQRPELLELVNQHEADEERLHGLVQNLDETAFDSAQWEGCLKQLQEAVLRHAVREEEHFFPQLLHVMGDQRAAELEQHYLLTRRTLLETL